MFANCCGHATIVAPRQPLSALIGAEPRANPGLANVRVLLLPGGLQPDDETSDDCSCPEFAQDRASTESRAGRTTRFAAVNSSITRLRPRKRLQVRSFDITCSRGIASFLCIGHFLRQFSSRSKHRPPRPAQADIIHISRQNNAVRDLSKAVRSLAESADAFKH